MTKPDLAPRIAKLVDLPIRLHVTCTGAGAGVPRALWSVPGCSSFLAGAAFPYAADVTAELLGFEPARFSTPRAALDLAMASFMTAFDPAQPDKLTIGLGLTASVASTVPHRGDHRIYVACVAANRVLAADVTLPKGGPEARERDGDAADATALEVLLAAAGLGPAGAYADRTAEARKRFFERPYFDRTGRRHELSALPEGAALFPGAFNPPHEGHLAMARGFGLSHRVVLAVTADPPHKAALGVGDLLSRAKMLAHYDRVFTEGDALYVEKARRFPGRTFIVGADALVRMLDPRWGPSTLELCAELAKCRARFVVVGRLVDARFLTLGDVVGTIPEAHRGLFEEAPGRWDVSSTALRRALEPSR